MNYVNLFSPRRTNSKLIHCAILWWWSGMSTMIGTADLDVQHHTITMFFTKGTHWSITMPLQGWSASILIVSMWVPAVTEHTLPHCGGDVACRQCMEMLCASTWHPKSPINHQSGGPCPLLLGPWGTNNNWTHSTIMWCWCGMSTMTGIANLEVVKYDSRTALCVKPNPWSTPLLPMGWSASILIVLLRGAIAPEHTLPYCGDDVACQQWMEMLLFVMRHITSKQQHFASTWHPDPPIGHRQGGPCVHNICVHGGPTIHERTLP